MPDPSSTHHSSPSAQGRAPALTGRLREALGGVDDDVQEPVEPRGLVVCGGESRGCVRAQLPRGQRAGRLSPSSLCHSKHYVPLVTPQCPQPLGRPSLRPGRGHVPPCC